MSRHDWGDVLGLLFVLALVLIMVRPSSNAPIIIGALGQAFANIITFATDSGTAAASAAGEAGSALGNLGSVVA